MILLTNGCSWTWGGGLDLDSTEDDLIRNASTWPAHLAKFLNAEEVVQLAAGCGSNQRILRTTLDWILNQPTERLTKTVAIIQWTEFSRFEYYSPKDPLDYYENFSERWVRAKIGCVMDPYATDDQTSLQRADARLQTYTEIEGLYRNIFECAALSDIFNKYGIKYYYWKYRGYYPKDPIKITNFLESYNWFKDSHTWEYERISEKDKHPSFQGHIDIANIIFNEMKENKL